MTQLVERQNDAIHLPPITRDQLDKLVSRLYASVNKVVPVTAAIHSVVNVLRTILAKSKYPFVNTPGIMQTYNEYATRGIKVPVSDNHNDYVKYVTIRPSNINGEEVGLVTMPQIPAELGQLLMEAIDDPSDEELQELRLLFRDFGVGECDE